MMRVSFTLTWISTADAHHRVIPDPLNSQTGRQSGYMDYLVAYRLNRFGTRYGWWSHLVLFHLAFVREHLAVGVAQDIWPGGGGLLQRNQRLCYRLNRRRDWLGWLRLARRWWRRSVHTSGRLSRVRRVSGLQVRVPLALLQQVSQ